MLKQSNYNASLPRLRITYAAPSLLNTRKASCTVYPATVPIIDCKQTRRAGTLLPARILNRLYFQYCIISLFMSSSSSDHYTPPQNPSAGEPQLPPACITNEKCIESTTINPSSPAAPARATSLGEESTTGMPCIVIILLRFLKHNNQPDTAKWYMSFTI